MVPSLVDAYKQLYAETAHYLGFGRGVNYNQTKWIERQNDSIKQCVDGGLRMVYECGHDWSWKRPVEIVTLPSGAATVLLPEYYGGRDGEATLKLASGQICGRLPFGPIQRVYDRHAESPSATGRPIYLCEEPIKGTTIDGGTRQQLHVWPIADQSYQLQFPMFICEDALTTPYPYAFGGPELAQTRLAACKAYAEMVLDGIQDGPMAALFQQSLAASIESDSRHVAKRIGYNGDRSSMRSARYGRGFLHQGVTNLFVNGVEQ